MKKLIYAIGIIAYFSSLSFSAWTEYDRGSSDVTVTLGDVVNRVRQIIDDPNSPNGTVRYSSAPIYDLVNTAQAMFCINTRALEASATQQLLANTTEYALPVNYLFMDRVTIDENADGDFQYIEMEFVKQLDLVSPDWSVNDSSQTPLNYYIRNRQLGLYAVPNNTGAIIKIWYIRSPTKMTADTDIIFDNYSQLEPYWEALADYAAYHIFLQEGDLQRASQYAQSWTQMLTLANQILRNELDSGNINTTGTEYKNP